MRLPAHLFKSREDLADKFVMPNRRYFKNEAVRNFRLSL